ncbi:Catechol 2,3-dioxygenase [Desulfotomaculum arcticum]|uniref:Catechol 2,3-dioxygenase n=1 Tax=Desulfotruncus arcticus DSM 17038 TaxID=1121424 RepID=A0A1I2NC67_9FIRM|nr:VOC family protein [Desulfotruncus arcticus]SFF98951.1 Catechol 2,3-dioxygenase [Desulfotomaculum arcticum] [Desulfotruncus arcticus DSM 17038]
MKIKFAHTNIISCNWEKLAQFYINVFGCELVYPERNLQGEWIDKVTNLSNVHIRGIHLRLPGYADGPTLEIFTYNKQDENNGPPAINKPGFAHIAFLVDDVQYYFDKVIEHGGSALGALAEQEVADAGILTIAYMRDPEGNLVEILNWR